ncbi:MAG TPA: sugar transferase [Tepidisphaeraceae bacterium]|jgi:lipopolysaccharide/colanic/teichoic acid biosynthesis glycosyltransferase
MHRGNFQHHPQHAGQLLQFTPSVTATSLRPARRWYVHCKVVLDWLAALVLLVPSAIIIGVLAVLVKVTSAGPALYLQRRVGLNGRAFTMIKLRTMDQNSEAKTGPVWSQPGDARVTALGRILRDTHLDELPQLWNVLRGQMSLIGPRPERPELIAQLEAGIPGYRDRLAVRPGLTGLAQVQLPPDVNDDTVRRKLSYDCYYIAHISPWLDLRIALSTCLYFFSAAAKAMCNSIVRSYRREIERMSIVERVEEQRSPSANPT